MLLKAPCLRICLIALLTLSAGVLAKAAPVQTEPKSKSHGKASPAEVERALKESLRRAPESFEANHQLGEFHLQAGQLSAAIPLLEKAQQLNPTHYTNSYDLALAYLQLGELAKARAQIQRILARKETAELHSLLAEIEEKDGKLVAAAEEYQRAARMDESEQNILNLGNSLIKINAFDAAVQILTYGLKKYSQSGMLRVGLGIALYSRGDYEEAVKFFCAAVDLEPTDPRPYLFLGEMYGVSAEMADEILKRMAQFVKYHPENALAHYYYAMNLQSRRGPGHEVDLNQIETLLKTAIALDPKLARAHFELGALYSEQQKHKEAISALREAIRLEPGLAKAHYRLARLYQSTGQKDLAVQEMEIYQKLKERGAEPTTPKRPNP